MLEVNDSIDERFSKYYNIKASPEYIFCFYGSGYLKQTGVNYNKLKNNMLKIDNYYRENANDYRENEEYISFDKEYRMIHDMDRDLDNLGHDHK